MGGFLFWDKRLQPNTESGLRASLEVFENRRLSDGRGPPPVEVFETDRFRVYYYRKIAAPVGGILSFDNGDFILATGTLMYAGRSGSPALQQLYRDFEPDGFEFDSVQGQFCVLLYKQGALHIWNDYFGIYHVFASADRSVISSSFLAVVRQQDSRRVNRQALYEYVCEGASFADDSFVEGVELLDAFHVHQLLPTARTRRKRHSMTTIETEDFSARVAQTVPVLLDYFANLKNCFGDRACSALSGGFDSRLILALLLATGIEPRLYVYGSRGSADVRVASAIAAAEGLPLHLDSKTSPQLTPEQFRDLVRAEYFFGDGHGQNGVFGNGAEFRARTWRADAAPLQLNGGGGEIFRNFWNLADRPVSIDAFVKARFDRLPAACFGDDFDRRDYLSNLHRKILHMLEIRGPRLSRRDLERLYVYMRIKYWMGYNVGIQNVRSYALLPLTEPALALSSFSIPLEQKQMGRFEAALIEHLNPSLAAHTTAYGYPLSRSPPAVAVFAQRMRQMQPPVLQGWLRRMRTTVAHGQAPYYLQPDYLDAVLSPRNRAADSYIHSQRFGDPLMSSRLQTVNLVLADPF